MGTDIMKVVAILLLLVTIGVPISTADQAEGQSLKRAGEQLFGLIEKANEKVIGAVKEACEQAFNAVWTLIKEFGIRFVFLRQCLSNFWMSLRFKPRLLIYICANICRIICRIIYMKRLTRCAYRGAKTADQVWFTVKS